MLKINLKNLSFFFFVFLFSFSTYSKTSIPNNTTRSSNSSILDIIDFGQITQKWSNFYNEFFDLNNDFSKRKKAFKEAPLNEKINSFSTDGCSSFPDGTLKHKTLWRDCCIAHDLAYFVGGPKDLRIAADKALKTCVIEKVKEVKSKKSVSIEAWELMAEYMEKGVAIGDKPNKYVPWRWGYGWEYQIGYNSLSEQQRINAWRAVLEYRYSVKFGETPNKSLPPVNPDEVISMIDDFLDRLSESSALLTTPQ